MNVCLAGINTSYAMAEKSRNRPSRVKSSIQGFVCFRLDGKLRHAAAIGMSRDSCMAAGIVNAKSDQICAKVVDRDACLIGNGGTKDYSSPRVGSKQCDRMARSWSSLVVGDEGWIGPSRKLLCLC